MEFSNDMRMTVWPKNKGEYGEYYRCVFEINGVEYVCFLSKPETKNANAPALVGKIKVSQKGPQQTQQQRSVETQKDESGDDLPF